MADLKSNHAADAIEEACRVKTVAIVSGSGKQRWRGLGTGTLVNWNGMPLILTADHVLGETNPADLRFFPPFPAPPGKVERHELVELKGATDSQMQGFIKLPLETIHRDVTLDLAAIELPRDVRLPRPAEFFEMVKGAGTPAVGTTVTMTGFPHDMRRQLGDGAYVAFLLADWGEVVEPPADLPASFNSAVHFTVPCGQVEQYGDALPHGLSGSALWFRRGSTPELWHPNLEIGGVTVSWFKKHNLLKIIRRETVEAFLAEKVGW